MLLDLSQFKASDLNGQEFPIADLAKTLGNGVFMNCQNIEQSDLGRAIWKGEAFEIAEQDLEFLKQFLLQDSTMKFWIKSQLIQYIDNLKTEPEAAEVAVEEIKG